MSAREDVHALVMEQQQLMAGKLRDVTAARGVDRQSLFDDYRRYLAAHHGAEQSWIYTGTGGPAPDTAGIQIDGQDHAAHLIEQLEQVGIDSEEFDNLINELSTQTRRHAGGQRQHLPALMSDTTDSDTDLMLRALLTVPTVAAGNGHSITRSDVVIFADLLLQAKDFFAAMPRTDPASTTPPADRIRTAAESEMVTPDPAAVSSPAAQ